MLAATYSPGTGIEFVAGFVEGMVHVNHLTEIEQCGQGWEIMIPEIQKGIEDIEKGGWDFDVQAGLEFALVILQIPQAIQYCE